MDEFHCLRWQHMIPVVFLRKQRLVLYTMSCKAIASGSYESYRETLQAKYAVKLANMFYYMTKLNTQHCLMSGVLDRLIKPFGLIGSVSTHVKIYGASSNKLG